MMKIENDELLKSAQKLQKEAERVIDELGLFSILKEISEPVIVGSVKNGLMVWSDIDIHAYVKEYDINKVLDLLKRFALLSTIQKVQFSNFRELRRDHLERTRYLPRAYYVGLRSVQPSGEWKIDIWFKKKEASINDYNVLNSLNITKKQKAAILKLKKTWLDEKGGYKNGVMSTDIYKAVLEQGIMDQDNFKAYIKKMRKI